MTDTPAILGEGICGNWPDDLRRVEKPAGRQGGVVRDKHKTTDASELLYLLADYVSSHDPAISGDPLGTPTIEEKKEALEAIYQLQGLRKALERLTK